MQARVTKITPAVSPTKNSRVEGTEKGGRVTTWEFNSKTVTLKDGVAAIPKAVMVGYTCNFHVTTAPVTDRMTCKS